MDERGRRQPGFQDGRGTRSSADRAGWLFGGVALVFAISVAANLSLLVRQGRLATSLQYDDVSYLSDALARLTFDSRSLWTIIQSFVANPPHAPMSTVMGMVGFGLLGPNPLAAYATNAWILALFLAFILARSRPLASPVQRFLFVAMFLFLPLAQSMITEFRPDLAAGLIFALALRTLFETDLMQASLRRRISVGLLGVAAVAAKPAAFVVTIPMEIVGAAIVLAIQSRAYPPKLVFRRAIPAILTYVLVGLPFGLLWAPSMIPYAYQALYSNADIWHTNPDRLYNWLYHSFGAGGSKAFKPFLIPAFAIIAWDIAALARERRALAARLELGHYGALAFLYAAMATSAEKTVFQGSLFYLPLALTFVTAFVRRLASLGSPAPIVLVLLAAIDILLLFTRPIASTYTTALPSVPSNAVVEHVGDYIQAKTRDPACTAKGPFRMATLNPNPIPPEAVSFEMTRRGMRLAIESLAFSRDRDVTIARALAAQAVIVPSLTSPSLDKRMPSFNDLAAVEAALLDASDRRTVTIETPGQEPILISEKRSC